MKATAQIIAQVGHLLSVHLEKSKTKATPALDQRPAEEIAEALQLKKYFENGFESADEINSFVSTYLSHTNHLQHPHYMGIKWLFRKIYRGYLNSYTGVSITQVLCTKWGQPELLVKGL